MDDRITRLEEQMALIQADLFQLSDELFTQQQEIGHLRREIEHSKAGYSLHNQIVAF